MHPAFTEALLLRSVKYGDSDVVATLLTPSMGVVGALARGARKSMKRFGAALDFFNLVRAEVRPSRSGMPALLSVELVRLFERPRMDMDAYAAAHHLLEVANLGTRENDTAPAMWKLLVSALDAMEEGGDPTTVGRIFQIRAIGLLGYSLGGETCSACGSPLEGGAVFVDFMPRCQACGAGRGRAVSAGARKTLTAALGPRPWRLAVSGVVEEEIGELVEDALAAALHARPRTSIRLV